MLSIVIPTLKEKENLERLLQSLEKQTYKDFEVIVADAGSTDGTIKIAEKYGASIVKGGRVGVGRNAGAKVAKGDLIYFFDADVVLTQDFIENTLKKFEEKKLDIATCFFTPISEKKIDKLLHELVNFYYRATQKFLPHAAGFCILIRKEIHQHIRGFKESVVLGEDIDYVGRAAKFGKFGIITDQRIYVSVRRLEKDGRLNIALKYLLAEAYIIFVGEIKTDIFRYKFAHYDKKKQERIKDKVKIQFKRLVTKNFPASRYDPSRLYNELIDSLRRNNSK